MQNFCGKQADVNLGRCLELRELYGIKPPAQPYSIMSAYCLTSDKTSGSKPKIYRYYTYVADTILMARYMMMFRSAMLLGEVTVEKVVTIQAIETANQVTLSH